MAAPTDLLREIQADIAAFRKETGERLKALESGQRSIRRRVEKLEAHK